MNTRLFVIQRLIRKQVGGSEMKTHKTGVMRKGVPMTGIGFRLSAQKVVFSTTYSKHSFYQDVLGKCMFESEVNISLEHFLYLNLTTGMPKQPNY